MPQLRLALAQVNPTVGDLAGNCAQVVQQSVAAAAAGAQFIAFPEMVVAGYPVEDLALRSSFVHAARAATEQLAHDLAEAGVGDIPVVVGYLDETTTPSGTTRPVNRAAVLHSGEITSTYTKHHLPNYGVFDEFRVFAAGDDLTIITVNGVQVALAICEDLWQDGGPVAQIGDAGAHVLLALNGSPYERHKDDQRLQLVRRRAQETGCHVAYVNLVGGQDDLVFDGDSIVVDPHGTVLARAPQFVDHLLCTTIEVPPAPTPPASAHTTTLTTRPHHNTPWPADTPQIAPALPDCAETYHALVTGLRDYVCKNGFKSVLLGFSGGIDSALVAAIAADAIGPNNVYGIAMPSEYSSEHSLADAKELSERLGCHYQVTPITDMVQPFTTTLGLTGLSAENIQARVRGMILMSQSNLAGHLVLATSNKSEVSVGYSTIYGDSVGGFAPIKDVPKTLVWELSRWRNNTTIAGIQAPIPPNSITKPPSAELRPDQVDSDSLPDYDILDAILWRYVDLAKGRDELINDGFHQEIVDRVVALVDRAEWKRRQSAPGTKISALAFGRDRRLPITSKWREQHAPLHLPTTESDTP